MAKIRLDLDATVAKVVFDVLFAPDFSAASVIPQRSLCKVVSKMKRTTGWTGF